MDVLFLCRWGCDHERTAREAYFKVTASKHSSFSINDAGLFINPDTPFIGATPDGLVHCDCCGDGVLEVKCPYSKKDVPMETACADPSFCLSTSDQARYSIEGKSSVLLSNSNSTPFNQKEVL